MKIKKLKKNRQGRVYLTNTLMEIPNPIRNDLSNAKQKIDKSIKVLSLFSGCGGMDLGFEGGFEVHKECIHKEYNADFIDSEVGKDYIRLIKNRFEIVFANDILKDAKIAWLHNFSKLGYKENIFHSQSIVDLVKKHKRGQQIFPKNVDIVTGGFPCQDFSVAGKRNGLNSHKDHAGNKIIGSQPTIETRGQLYLWMKEVIEITKPKMFIAENVKGLVNLSNVKEIIQNDFSKADNDGYIVLEPQVLHSADYGVPQSRQRVFFIGIKKSALNSKALKIFNSGKIPNEYSPYPKPSHAFNNKSNGLVDPVFLRTIFSHLEEPNDALDLSQRYYSKAKFMGRHCQGQTEVKLDWIGPTIRAEHHGNIEFRRLSKDLGGKNIEELKQGKIERRLTPRECAMIQSFPKNFEFVLKERSKFKVSPSGAYKIIGNAVPPLLAFHIAKRIEKIWNKYFD